jgi:hypothetical protein
MYSNFNEVEVKVEPEGGKSEERLMLIRKIQKILQVFLNLNLAILKMKNC